MSAVSDLLKFFLARKRAILIPIMLALLLVSVLMILSANSAIAPFVYALF